MLEQLEDFNLSQSCDGKLEKRGWRLECRRPDHLCLENSRGVTMQLGRSCCPLSHLHSHQDMVQPSLSFRTASLAAAFAV